MALERIYNIPLRKEWLKVPRYKRAKKAVKALREFLARHMKAEIENIKVTKWLNESLWERGIKKPPHHIKVKAIKDDKGIVNVHLVDLPQEALEEIKREEEKKKEKEKKKKEKAGEEKKEAKPAEPKKDAEKTDTGKEAKEKEEKEKIMKKEAPQAKVQHETAQPKNISIKRKALKK